MAPNNPNAVLRPLAQNLLLTNGETRAVRVGLIGAGQFGTAIVTQAPYISSLDVRAIADVHIEAAKLAFERAGLDASDIVACSSQVTAQKALELGKYIVVEDASILMNLQLDVIVEATGITEAGALHAHQAIQHGKHVAMVNKETDATIGPILANLANQAGLVYTPVDGDQHGLLIGMVAWARNLGLEVLCGGKARDAEFTYDLVNQKVTSGRHEVTLREEDLWCLRPILPGQVKSHILARREVLTDLPQLGNNDLTELVIAANATGLMPDIETTHHPVIHTREIPEVLCSEEDGGLLKSRSVVDAVTCLRQPHEAGLGGGVFITVACENDYSRMILTTKGLISNSKGTSMLIYRPYHLCGVETPTSILLAALAGLTTGSKEVLPSLDIVAQATRDLKAGEVVGGERSKDIRGVLVPAVRVINDSPLPFHMGSGYKLIKDVSAGSLITRSDVQAPSNSILWSLRAQQDKHFLIDSER